MNGNFMAVDQAIIQLNNEAYGSNRISYVPIIEGLCGGARNWGAGKLMEACHKVVDYNVTQKFPVNEVSAVLRSTQTDLVQAHGKPIIFSYNQYAEAVEFKRSNLSGMNVTNINAGIIKELWKKYDTLGYIGVFGNQGFKTNTGTETEAAAWNDFATLKAAIDGAVNRLKSALGLTTNSYVDVNFTYTAGVAAILGETSNENISNREKLEKAYPGLVFQELPAMIENDEMFYISYRPMLTFHHASRPGLYGTQVVKYGLTDESLFTFESNAVQVEEVGAIQQVTKTA